MGNYTEVQRRHAYELTYELYDRSLHGETVAMKTGGPQQSFVGRRKIRRRLLSTATVVRC